MSTKLRVKCEYRAASALTTEEIDEAWGVYGPHHNVSYEEFVDRLRNNIDFYALFRDQPSGKLIGATALRRKEFQLASGKKILGIYSGMSYIEPAYRRKHLVPKTLLRFGIRFWLQSPFRKIFVWYDAISYKTYLLPFRTNRRMYPSRLQPTPAYVKEFMNLVGTCYYGDLYDPESGTVRKTEKRLKDYLAPIGPEELKNPDIRFYAEANPGHAQGHGLLCVSPFNLSNTSMTFLKSLKKQLGLGKKAKIRVAQPKTADVPHFQN